MKLTMASYALGDRLCFFKCNSDGSLCMSQTFKIQYPHDLTSADPFSQTDTLDLSNWNLLQFQIHHLLSFVMHIWEHKLASLHMDVQVWVAKKVLIQPPLSSFSLVATHLFGYLKDLVCALIYRLPCLNHKGKTFSLTFQSCFHHTCVSYSLAQVVWGWVHPFFIWGSYTHMECWTYLHYLLFTHSDETHWKWYHLKHVWSCVGISSGHSQSGRRQYLKCLDHKAWVYSKIKGTPFKSYVPAFYGYYQSKELGVLLIQHCGTPVTELDEIQRWENMWLVPPPINI